MNYFLKFVTFLFINFAYTLTYVVASLVPKNRSIWIFGAWFGQKYADNSRALFEYAQKNGSNSINYYWIYKNKSLINSIPKNGVYAYSIFGIWIQVRAGVCVMSQDKDDFIRPIISARVTKVQLWHGFPIKKIGLDARKNNNNKYLEYLANKKIKVVGTLFPYKSNKCNMVAASSDFDACIFKKAFEVDGSRVYITGYPRNDSLIKKQKTKNKIIKIIYLPTFRGMPGSSYDLFFQHEWDTLTVNKILNEFNAEMHIRFHPVHVISEKDKILVNSDRVKILEGDWDASSEISSYDVLVTDYSSVYVDYILVGGKIVLAQFDLNDYIKNSRDCYIDFSKLPADAKMKAWSDFKDAMQKITEDNFVKVNKDFFYRYNDGLASSRVYSKILEIN